MKTSQQIIRQNSYSAENLEDNVGKKSATITLKNGCISNVLLVSNHGRISIPYTPRKKEDSDFPLYCKQLVKAIELFLDYNVEDFIKIYKSLNQEAEEFEIIKNLLDKKLSQLEKDLNLLKSL